MRHESFVTNVEGNRLNISYAAEIEASPLQAPSAEQKKSDALDFEQFVMKFVFIFILFLFFTVAMFHAAAIR